MFIYSVPVEIFSQAQMDVRERGVKPLLPRSRDGNESPVKPLSRSKGDGKVGE
jgi:hypothetical protein